MIIYVLLTYVNFLFFALPFLLYLLLIILSKSTENGAMAFRRAIFHSVGVCHN